MDSMLGTPHRSLRPFWCSWRQLRSDNNNIILYNFISMKSRRPNIVIALRVLPHELIFFVRDRHAYSERPENIIITIIIINHAASVSSSASQPCNNRGIITFRFVLVFLAFCLARPPHTRRWAHTARPRPVVTRAALASISINV